MALLFSSSYNAFIYRLTYTEATGFKVAWNNQKAIAMYFSTTENFLFHFLTVQSSARRWRSSEKPFPPWIPQFPEGVFVTFARARASISEAPKAYAMPWLVFLEGYPRKSYTTLRK